MPNIELECKDCKKKFDFPERDQEFYESKGYTPPKRCKDCREINKQKKEKGGDRKNR